MQPFPSLEGLHLENLQAMMKKLLQITLLSLLFIPQLRAQVVINEFMFTNLCSDANPNQFMDNFGNCSDWVELYNSDAVAVDLTGHYLTDRLTNLDKWPFPAGSSIPANGFLRIWLSGRPDVPFDINNLHANFMVGQTDDNEIIALVAPDGTTILDINEIEQANMVGYTTGRFPDGAADWRVFTTPTMAAPNSATSFIGYTPTPVFDVPAGYQGGPIAVTITCDDPNAEIRYATNGSFPTQASALYTGPVNLDQSSVLMARAFSPDAEYLPSYYQFSTYFFGADQHTLPVFSVAGTEVPTLFGGTQIEPISTMEVFDENGNRESKSLGDTNKHGNDSWAYQQRGIDWVDRDKMGYSGATHLELFREKDRDEFKTYMFKAAANDNYPFANGAHIRDSYIQSLSQVGNLELDERTHESCILYVNGEYWGVYDYREKVDDWRFTQYYYGQGKYEIDFLKTWGGTWAEYGEQGQWNTFRDFVLNNDMTDPANYEYVKSQLEVLSLMDYFIMNTWVVASDWLNWNTAWWRGYNPDGGARKWRYILWDMDATFGHYINYTGIPDTGPNADPCFAEVLNNPGGQGHVPMWNALLENDEFRATYINRYADHMNTTFSCDFAVAHLDSLINIIEPEMQRQIDRWGGTMQGWQNNVDELRDFILQRCGTELVESMEDCYDLEAITLTILINGDGSVLLNDNVTITPDMTPWTGTYYAGIPIDLSGIPGIGVDFIDWQVVDGVLVIDDENNPNITITADGNIEIIANFDPPVPPVMVTFTVEPEGAGNILAYGTNLAPYPNSSLVQPGEFFELEALENPWFTFSHWESNANPFGMDPSEAMNEITIEEADTIRAVFEVIPRSMVTVRVEPPGAGRVQKDGALLYPLPWSGLLEEEVPFNFSANPEAFWYFDRWESIANPIPNGGSERNFDMSFTAPDTLVAHFVQEPFNVYVPNSFTPNNDGRNDVFLPSGTAWLPGSYELMVFNRWGEVVFQSTDPTVGWDGSHENGDYYVRDEVYIYRLKIQSVHSIEPEEYSGHIMVFR